MIKVVFKHGLCSHMQHGFAPAELFPHSYSHVAWQVYKKENKKQRFLFKNLKEVDENSNPLFLG